MRRRSAGADEVTTRERCAAFLDRDGVLNERPAPHEYVTSVEGLVIVAGAAAGVARLRAAGFVPIVVSNQRGVSRGLVAPDTLAAVERRFTEEGVDIEAYFYCEHGETDACDCRKPRPGLLLRAAEEYGFSLRRSVLIGDSESDIEAGIAVDCHTVRIDPACNPTTRADAVAPDFEMATRITATRWGCGQFARLP